MSEKTAKLHRSLSKVCYFPVLNLYLPVLHLIRLIHTGADDSSDAAHLLFGRRIQLHALSGEHRLLTNAGACNATGMYIFGLWIDIIIKIDK